MSFSHHATKLRVVLADDHAVLRRGLASLLAQHDDLVVVGEAADAETAVARHAELTPDILLIDLRMRGSIAAIERIRVDRTDARILALASVEDADGIERALAAGALGCVWIDASVDAIAAAIRNACTGRAVSAVSREQVAHVQLTKRELALLRVLADGALLADLPDQTEVAAALFAKLGVATTADAIAAGVRRGLVRSR